MCIVFYKKIYGIYVLLFFAAERNVFRPIVFLIFYERPCLVFQNSKQNQLGVVIMDVVG